MKIKKTLLSALLIMGCISVSAQDSVKYVFAPHWYIQGQIGGQYTLGEISFDKLLSPNAQLGVGYNLNPALGFRFSINAWQSKAGSTIDSKEYKWNWKYVAPAIDVTTSITNLIYGYNPKRLVNVGAFAGIGANIGLQNDEAQDVKQQLTTLYPIIANDALYYLWDGTKARFMGRVGANVDFRINDALSVGLELQAATLNDRYNSKKADNTDWYFNALVGVKYCFGKTHTKEVIAPVAPATAQQAMNGRVVEKVVEKIVEKPVEVVKQEPIQRDIFFTINSTTISLWEMQKVAEIAEYMKKYPNAKVEITGYSDKGTGTTAINAKLAAQRAQTVVNVLKNNYGIAADRITSSSKGDTVQPFKENVLNRVSICVAK